MINDGCKLSLWNTKRHEVQPFVDGVNLWHLPASMVSCVQPGNHCRVHLLYSFLICRPRLSAEVSSRPYIILIFCWLEPPSVLHIRTRREHSLCKKRLTNAARAWVKITNNIFCGEIMAERAGSFPVYLNPIMASTIRKSSKSASMHHGQMVHISLFLEPRRLPSIALHCGFIEKSWNKQRCEISTSEDTIWSHWREWQRTNENKNSEIFS